MPKTIEYVKDRSAITDQLLENIITTTAEKELLQLAAQQKDIWAEAVSTFYSSKLLEAALEKHSKALITAAEASDRYAKGLTKATWVLAGATIVLALGTIVLLFK